MAETEHITVAEVSEGRGGSADPDAPVSLPVVELLTGRGFVTGKSGSGKSNSASVISEKLLDSGFGLLIVDVDGEYYGLKEEYEILHVGADEECDVQVATDHAEKLASLALEGNVPIILDVSSFIDEDEAEAVLTELARHLFAKAKKQKQPFLLLVEEVHEYVPEGGSVGECGKALIKISKRGRKHGLGICGISQRPADVKKDFITQCDWLLWHRLTWDNDTKVVRRVLDGEYAAAVEDLDDGEGFLMTDWSESVRRVQFYRKRTFDAGATPGLEDFERPELKSVSDDLVAELETVADEDEDRQDRIEELRAELDQKDSRIAELEAELQDARDLSRMADQFVDALVNHVDGQNPGRTEQERMQASRERTDDELGAAGTEPRNGTGSDGETADGDGDDGGTDDRFSAAEVLRRLEAVDEPGTNGETTDETPATEDSGPRGRDPAEEPLPVRELKADIGGMETRTREMLEFYRNSGPATPVEAHVAAGGDGDRNTAYAHNRRLRTCGLVEHVGRGHYDYRLQGLLAEELGGDAADDSTVRTHARNVERTVLGSQRS
ncbi:MAG: helicase HerA domain-containing protein [Salinirussus sp.]